MPTYSYVCKDCGHAFDIQQAFTDDALTTCPECDGALRKVFSAVGVVFKGSGFYRTDSRGSGTGSSPSTTPSSSPADGAPAKTSGATPTKTSSPAAPSTPSAASSSSSTGSA